MPTNPGFVWVYVTHEPTSIFAHFAYLLLLKLKEENQEYQQRVQQQQKQQRIEELKAREKENNDKIKYLNQFVQQQERQLKEVSKTFKSSSEYYNAKRYASSKSRSR